MNKDQIKTAVSIEFGLHKAEAGNIVDTIFEEITMCIIKNKKLELKKFGKFILSKDKKRKYIEFIPAGKFAGKINNDFEDLEKVSVKWVKMRQEQDTAPIHKSDNPKLSATETPALSSPITQEVTQRKLISDDLVKLHLEITKEENDIPKVRNIWG
ncbi:MAG: HU family DNA-binding protein [bacterium]|nr:HU family DNA-binding protein [bacterium]